MTMHCKLFLFLLHPSSSHKSTTRHFYEQHHKLLKQVLCLSLKHVYIYAVCSPPVRYSGVATCGYVPGRDLQKLGGFTTFYK